MCVLHWLKQMIVTFLHQGLAILLFSLAAADNFMSELEKLKGNAGFDSFDSQKVDLEQSLDDKRVKRFPQFTHFGSPASPYAPAPAPYTPAVYAPEPYVAPAPAPAPYAPPPPPPPAPYAPPEPVYHEPAPYAPPPPVYHEPAPYAPPAPVHHEPAPPAYHVPVVAPAPYHPPAPYHEPEHNEHGTIGHACVDYPCHAYPPYTKFSCANVPFTPGMYADPESGCQVTKEKLKAETPYKVSWEWARNNSKLSTTDAPHLL